MFLLSLFNKQGLLIIRKKRGEEEAKIETFFAFFYYYFMLFNLFSCSHTHGISFKKQTEGAKRVSEKKTSRVNELLVVYLRNR